MLKRGKQKVDIDYYFKDIFKRFKSTSKIAEIYCIDEKKFFEINEELNDLFMQELFDGKYIKLPAGMGNVQIIKYERRMRLKDGELDLSTFPINYQACWKLWQKKYPNLTKEEISKIKDKPLVYEENKHTRGYQYRFKWSRKVQRLKNKTYYGFFPIRKYQRQLTQLLKDPNFKGDFYGS